MVQKNIFFALFCKNILLFQIIVVPLQPRTFRESEFWTGVSPVGKDCQFGQSFFLFRIRNDLYAHLLHTFCIDIIFYYIVCHIWLIRI